MPGAIDVGTLFVLLILLVLAVTGWRWGADSREHDAPNDVWHLAERNGAGRGNGAQLRKPRAECSQPGGDSDLV
jgi:hypothetical protein